ncbi:hypothetical protein [Calycomorphotria hydatis]|uniref:Uncharacterized protein n=1 Tax=Calycomorphotria hydatis TaxID=2528027 RepID=A0A517TDA3_9PLAN|nr:hypothetical protein [Calycomorphotria hydatis]QDT66356.1 hypothetical protein V22_36220 [Calycomorphotria hydatis]
MESRSQPGRRKSYVRPSSAPQFSSQTPSHYSLPATNNPPAPGAARPAQHATGGPHFRIRSESTQEPPQPQQHEQQPYRTVREVMAEYEEKQQKSFTPSEEVTPPTWQAVSRGVSLFLGLLMLATVADAIMNGVLSNQYWWIALDPIPADASRMILAGIGGLFLLFAAFPVLPGPLRFTGSLTAATFAGFLMRDAVAYFQAIQNNQLAGGPLVPFSLYLAALMLVVLAGFRLNIEKTRIQDTLLTAMVFAIMLIAVPVTQYFCMSRLNDHHDGDRIVILNAAANVIEAAKGKGAELEQKLSVPIIDASQPPLAELSAEQLPEVLLRENPDLAGAELILIGPDTALTAARTVFAQHGFTINSLPIATKPQREPKTLLKMVPELLRVYFPTTKDRWQMLADRFSSSGASELATEDFPPLE